MPHFPGWYIVEFYPSSGRFVAYGPRATEDEVNHLFADLIQTALPRPDMHEIRVGKFLAATGEDPCELARAAGMGA